MSNRDNCCLARVLKVIDVLQKNSSGCDNSFEGCDKPFLGIACNILNYNTRPITLYTRDNTLFTATLNDGSTTNYFRVEDVDGCCAKLRLLIYDATATTYTSTTEFITVNLNCFCVLKCQSDIALDYC